MNIDLTALTDLNLILSETLLEYLILIFKIRAAGPAPASKQDNDRRAASRKIESDLRESEKVRLQQVNARKKKEKEGISSSALKSSHRKINFRVKYFYYYRSSSGRRRRRSGTSTSSSSSRRESSSRRQRNGFRRPW